MKFPSPTRAYLGHTGLIPWFTLVHLILSLPHLIVRDTWDLQGDHGHAQALSVATNSWRKHLESIYHRLGLDMSGQGPDSVLPSHPLCPEQGLSEWTPVAVRASVFEFDLPFWIYIMTIFCIFCIFLAAGS